LLAASLFAGWLALAPTLVAFDRSLHDHLTLLKPVQPAPANITLVDIDEASLRALGPWPWPRPVLAQLADNLRQRGAVLQIWDMALPEPSPQDTALVRQLVATDVVLGQIPVMDPSVQPAPQDGQLVPTQTTLPCSTHAPVIGRIGLAAVLAHAQAGHIAAAPDPDGRLRTLPAVVCDQGQKYPQLILAAAQAATPDQVWQISPGRWPWSPAQYWRRGLWRFAVDAHGGLHIPYQRDHNAWHAISAHLLLDPSAALPKLQGQTVLIGATALGLVDVVATPYHPRAPGLSVHAELLASAMGQQAWVNQPTREAPWLAMLFTALLGMTMLPLARQRRVHTLWLGIPVVLIAPFLIAIAVGLTGARTPIASSVLALALLLLGLAIAQAQQQRQTSQRLIYHLESFLPSALANQVAQQVPNGESLGQPCVGVVLGVCLAGLDKWVSAVDSLQALALTHAVHAATQRVAQLHGGQFAHAQGNYLYIAWTDSNAHTTRTALSCARALAAELAPVLQQNEATHRPLSLYQALEQGSYLLGLVGGRNSRRLVLLGPVINEVMGILSLNAELASALIVGPQAANALAQSSPGTTSLQSLGTFLLPDIGQQSQLFRIVTTP
jgi:adenylate cyclase